MNEKDMKQFYKRLQLSMLVDSNSTEAVRNEVKKIFGYFNCDEKGSGRMLGVFDDIVDMFSGKYPGYLSCTTEYHDLKHTFDVLIASLRLADAVNLQGGKISPGDVEILVFAAMMHDVGYIPEEGDDVETGAVYTSDHVKRGADFAQIYLAKKGYDKSFIESVAQIIMCTDLMTDIENTKFVDDQTENLGIILAAGDLLGQMADRVYLEKLLFLYKEFRAGMIPGFEKEVDILKNTVEFYKKMEKRFSHELQGVDRNMVYHFKERYGIDKDLYRMGIDNNIKYLKYILENHIDVYRDHLRRDGLVEKLDN